MLLTIRALTYNTTNLIPPLFIEVPVSSQEIERSCKLCVSFFLPFSYRIFELLRVWSSLFHNSSFITGKIIMQRHLTVDLPKICNLIICFQFIFRIAPPPFFPHHDSVLIEWNRLNFTNDYMFFISAKTNVYFVSP